MSLQLPEPRPAPAASAAGAGAPANQPQFPVYDPNSAAGRMAAVTAPIPDNSIQSPDPMAEFHKHVAKEPGRERELLFTIGGKPLYAPHDDDIDPRIGFRMIRDMRKHGAMMAAVNAMGELLGDEALDILADAPKMSKEDWNIILEVLQDKVFSRMTDQIPGGKG